MRLLERKIFLGSFMVLSCFVYYLSKVSYDSWGRERLLCEPGGRVSWAPGVAKRSRPAVELPFASCCEEILLNVNSICSLSFSFFQEDLKRFKGIIFSKVNPQHQPRMSWKNIRVRRKKKQRTMQTPLDSLHRELAKLLLRLRGWAGRYQHRYQSCRKRVHSGVGNY
jgi:hypothetical protein